MTPLSLHKSTTNHFVVQAPRLDVTHATREMWQITAVHTWRRTELCVVAIELIQTSATRFDARLVDAIHRLVDLDDASAIPGRTCSWCDAPSDYPEGVPACEEHALAIAEAGGEL